MISQNIGYYLTKYHPTHHNKEIWLTYLYMENSIFKLNHTVVQRLANAILKINPTVLQGCVDVIHIYGHTKLPTVT